MALTGGCLCGRVRYPIHGKIGPVVNCHCSSCRKAQGGAFGSNASVREKYFELLSGGDSVTDYESSPGKYRCFCSHCGSPLWSRRGDLSDERRIRLGTVDGDPGRRPLANAWLEEQGRILSVRSIAAVYGLRTDVSGWRVEPHHQAHRARDVLEVARSFAGPSTDDW